MILEEATGGVRAGSKMLMCGHSMLRLTFTPRGANLNDLELIFRGVVMSSCIESP